MAENIRLIHDIVDYADAEGLSGAILSLDQQKAFDRVDWSYMLRTLQAFGFGPTFCSLVKLLYTQVNLAVHVDGFLTELFPASRGVRQGCPLSPLLYVVVAETLASAIRAIRADPCIKGFPLPCGRKISKLSQYADDTSTFVRDGRSLVATFALFSRYERASGAKLNPGKSTGLLFGVWKTRVPADVRVKWSTVSINVRGKNIVLLNKLQNYVPR